MMTLIEKLRSRMAAAATGPFAHAEYPLKHTLDYPGDLGLFGPDSATWRVIGSPISLFGGIRGLLLQAAHPEVVAGVEDHSRYREDPLGRLSRTSNYVVSTSFGAMPEVENAIAVVRRRHIPISGTSHRDIPYSADDPGLSAWVHNSLTAGFLVSHQTFSGHPLTGEDADRFVSEQTRVGALLDSDPMPTTADELTRWVTEHPAMAPAPGMEDAVAFLRRPPLDLLPRVVYRFIFSAVVATIPHRIRTILGLRRTPGALFAGKGIAVVLRWALGSSPTWKLACLRIGAPLPYGVVFKQPMLADVPESKDRDS